MAAHRSTRVAWRVVPAAAAALLFALLGRPGAAVVAAAVALVLLVIGLAAPAAAASLDEAVARGAHAVGRGLNAVLGVVAWALLIFPVWATSRLAGLDVLDRGRRTETAWTDRGLPAPARPAASRPGTDLRSAHRQPLPRRLLRTGLLLALPVALLAVVVTRDGDGDAATTPAPDPFAYSAIGHEDEPFAPALFAELAKISGKWDPVLGSVPGEQRGRYVNVIDGHRKSYVPPDPELTVWFFGGSTTYGIGQRDDHTIPSVVAKLAEEDGIRIRAVNFGFPSYVNWQEVQRFTQELTAGEQPDLAVFYDGVNEMGLATERSARGDTDPQITSRGLISEYERTMWPKNRPDARPQELGIEAKAQLAGRQYGRGVDLARIVAKAYDVEVAFFWQPTLETKKPTPADAEVRDYVGIDEDRLPDLARLVAATIEASGADPIDLTASLDGIDTPVFLDAGHTNELGARVVAEAMYAELRPQLLALKDAT